MKKFWKIITNRMFLTVVLLVLQVLILLGAVYAIGFTYYWYAILFYALTVVIVLWLLNRDDNPAYKIAWIVLIMVVPLAGGVLYLIFGKSRTTKKMRKTINHFQMVNRESLPQDGSVSHELQEQNPIIGKHVAYLQSTIGHCAWKDTAAQFLSPGEDWYAALLQDLKNAKQFILMEYFIITPGEMWNSILEVLTQKVAEGVTVRLIYDDMGCIHTLPKNYDKKLIKLGIQTYVFNPFKAQLNAFMNNRDHRKITVVDGKIGYTGGANLADEYINRKERFGHWKDAAIRLEGKAVDNLTIMFLEMWEYVSGEKVDFSLFLCSEKVESNGYILPFDDNPIDEIRAAEVTYLNIIHSATKYVYIETPYLVMDNELTTALCMAAQSGIDVRIVTPHIPDKAYVFAVTRNSYRELIENGVKIYEYTPGFIHSKVIFSDDCVGVVGTANFDFRSLYLHFECGVWFYQSKVIEQVIDDFAEILKVSQPITLADCKKFKWTQRLFGACAKVFAPLM